MKTIEAIVVILAIGLAITILFDVSLFNSNQRLSASLSTMNQSYSNLNQNYSQLNQEFSNLQRLFWNNYPLTTPSFTVPNAPQQPPTLPPISKEQAIQIAKEYANWSDPSGNATATLNLVCISVTHVSSGEYNITGYVTTYLGEVTNPVANYSTIQIGEYTFQYLWIIDFHVACIHCAQYYVDAATGDVFTELTLF